MKYTMVADVKREIKLTASNTRKPALRCAALLIDKDGIDACSRLLTTCQSAVTSTKPIRTVDALQFHEARVKCCPAQWEKGKAGMGASPDGVAKYLSEENAAKL